MKRYHYIPDEEVVITNGALFYQDTLANFLLDSGGAAIAPPPTYNDLDYDVDDEDYGEIRHNLNTVPPVKIGAAIPEIDAIVNAVAGTIAAKEARLDLLENPVRSLADEKMYKKRDVQIEATSRWAGVAPQFSIYEAMYIFKELWDSIAAPSQNSTVDFTLVLDIFQAAEDAKDAVNLLPDIASVQAYDVVNDPAWP